MSDKAIDPGNEVNVNPARTSIQQILTRVSQYKGHGLSPQEVMKLAEHITGLHLAILRRPIGWTTLERKTVLAEVFPPEHESR